MITHCENRCSSRIQKHPYLFRKKVGSRVGPSFPLSISLGIEISQPHFLEWMNIIVQLFTIIITTYNVCQSNYSKHALVTPDEQEVQVNQFNSRPVEEPAGASHDGASVTQAAKRERGR